MCGIYGKINFRRSLNVRRSCAALNQLRHRGPDGFGVLLGSLQKDAYETYHNRLPNRSCRLEPDLFLGHRRLAIIDLSERALQPMWDSHERYAIVFNGEIYNFKELRETLEEKGHRFQTHHSDTEALLLAYAEWGPHCLEKLTGMFAFAIFDRARQRLFMARDRIGQKPFYYLFNQNTFVFGSELKPIVGYEGKFRVSPEGLSNYLKFGYVPDPQTFYSDIFKLKPGHYATLDLRRRTFRVTKYWDLSLRDNFQGSFREGLSAVEKTIDQSITLRLRSDVDKAVFLSGGIDSTTVAKRIAENSAQSTKAYSADLPDPKQSQRKFVFQAADQCDVDLKLKMVDDRSFAKFKELVSVFDEPFDGESSIALYELCSLISEKVVFSGDGGDEIYAGYRRYRKHDFRQRILRLLRRSGLAGPAVKLLSRFASRSRRLRRALEYASSSYFAAYINLKYSSDLLPLLRKKPAVEPFWASYVENLDPSIRSLQYLELKTILPGRMLYKLDRITMHHSLEARSPFMDHHLIERAFALPHKINKRKQILKRLLQRDFPKSFIHRPKQGFGGPVTHWFQRVPREEMFAFLSQPTDLIYRYLDYDKTIQRYPEIIQGYRGGRTGNLWKLVVLSHYLELNKDHIQHSQPAEFWSEDPALIYGGTIVEHAAPVRFGP